MFVRAPSFLSGLIFMSWMVGTSAAEEAPNQSAKPSVAPSANSLFNWASIAPAAADLRKASEALERFRDVLDSLSTMTASLATMSSEFDPFGYKTAFRTLGQQTETIQQQHQMIQELQEREIARLRNENSRLKKESQKSRKRNKTRK